MTPPNDVLESGEFKEKVCRVCMTISDSQQKIATDILKHFIRKHLTPKSAVEERAIAFAQFCSKKNIYPNSYSHELFVKENK